MIAPFGMIGEIIRFDAEGHFFPRVFELIIQFVDIGRKNPFLPVVICDLDRYVVFFVFFRSFCTPDAKKQVH